MFRSCNTSLYENRLNNLDSIRAKEKVYRKKYREENKEYGKKYREENKEYIKKQKREWYKRNNERLKEKSSKWYSENKSRKYEQKQKRIWGEFVGVYKVIFELNKEINKYLTANQKKRS